MKSSPEHTMDEPSAEVHKTVSNSGLNQRFLTFASHWAKNLRGCILFFIYGVNTVFWCTILFCVAILKLIIPIQRWRLFTNKILNWISFQWIRVNNFNMQHFTPTRIEVSGSENLDPDNWYLVLANHQSWVDILILQKICYKRIPFLKFFLKKELIWVPVLGIAWWALDFPFMKRYSKDFIKRNPHLQGKDMEITRKACEKFKTIPVSVMNFVEGTRFTEQKHQHQQSPYKNLLKPKAGGVAQVISAMGQHINYILNVTIVYRDKDISFWDFLCGKIGAIKVHISSKPISPELIGDYANDDVFRQQFQVWINTLWMEKNREIDVLRRYIN